MKKSSLILSGVLILCSCGGGGGGSNKTISVSIAPSTQTSIDQGQTMNFTAAVTNDSTNKGVTWNMSGTSCSGSACGTFTSSSTSAATYSAPQSVSAKLTVSVQATSAADSTKAASAALVVSPPPSITTTALTSGTVGTAYSATLAATGGSGTLTWALATGSSLPAGLSLSSSGALSGTPTVAGATNFTVKVTDASGGHEGPVSVTQQLSLTIAPVQLTITTTSPSNGVVGATYSASLAATGGTGTISWSVNSGNLPAGLSLSGSTISGTPTASGLASFTVSATDSGSPPQSKTQALSIMISPALSITTTSLPSGTAGSSYSQNIQTSGGTLPVSWSVSSGSLPAGLSIAGNSLGVGVLSGTPTTVGSSTFTVTAKDSSSPQASVNQQFTLVINAPPLTITTTTLPNGTVNRAYSAPLQASGGTPPYTWTVATGSTLPTWLTLGGSGSSWTLSGTPTTTAVATFSLTVVDSSAPQQSQTQALTLTIASASACGTGNESVLKGQYAFGMTGRTADGFFGVVGSFTADGNGNITAGSVDANGEQDMGNGLGAQSGTITASGSSYTMGADNRGCATIVTPFYTFITRFAIPPSTSGIAQGLIQESEPTGSEVFVGSGQIFQQQVPTAVPTGNWVHAQVGAIDTSQYESGLITSGVDVYSSGGTITNGEYDYQSYGSLTKQSGVTGTYTAPDPTTGRFTIVTTASLGTLGPKSLNRAAYLLSPTHILEITTSTNTILAGDVKLQSGSLTLSSNLAMYGTSPNNYGTVSEMAGFALVNATGTSYSGNFYQNVTGKWTTPSPVSTTCSYTIDSFGRVATSGTNCGSYYNPSTSAWSEPPVIYLTGPNTGFLAGSNGIWKVAPQSATTIAAGNYYLGTPQPDVDWGTGWDTVTGVAEVTSDGITGTEDKSRLPNENFNQTLTVNSDGTFSTSDNPGVITGLVISSSQLIELQDPTAIWPSILVINAVN